MTIEQQLEMMTKSRDNHRVVCTELNSLCIEAARILRPITDEFEGQGGALSKEYVLKIEEIRSRLLHERSE